MAPMVDMVFLLLVFFMCVSAVSGGRARMKLDLPETVAAKAAGSADTDTAGATAAGAGAATAATQAPQLVLSLSARGELSLNGVMLAPEALPATLRRLRAEGGAAGVPPPQVRIRAEASVPYRQIQTLLLACSQAGIDKISYAAHEAQLLFEPDSAGTALSPPPRQRQSQSSGRPPSQSGARLQSESGARPQSQSQAQVWAQGEGGAE